MFTNDNTNGLYNDDLLDEMNAALKTMLDAADQDVREQNEKNFSGWIMEVAEDGDTADDIVRKAKR